MTRGNDELLRQIQQAEVKPSEPISRRRRVRGPKPTEYDNDVWTSYTTGQTYDIGPVSEQEAVEVVKLVKRSGRYHAWRTGKNIKVSTQVLGSPTGQRTVKFQARPPYETGTRAHKNGRQKAKPVNVSVPRVDLQNLLALIPKESKAARVVCQWMIDGCPDYTQDESYEQ